MDTPILPISQIYGTVDKYYSDEKAHFDMKVEAHEKCSNSNFRAFDNKKIEKTNSTRFLVVMEDNDKTKRSTELL